MSFRSKERLAQCPFDPSHRIAPSKMSSHITKCRKNHPDADVAVCDYNSTHIVKRRLLQDHMAHCKDRAVFENIGRMVAQKREEVSRQQQESARVQIPRGNEGATASPEEEDWEAELVDRSYNPAEHSATRDFISPPPPGRLGKAGKRDWRISEEERVRNLREGRVSVADLIPSPVAQSSPMRPDHASSVSAAIGSPAKAASASSSSQALTSEVGLLRNMAEMSRHIVKEFDLDGKEGISPFSPSAQDLRAEAREFIPSDQTPMTASQAVQGVRPAAREHSLTAQGSRPAEQGVKPRENEEVGATAKVDIEVKSPGKPRQDLKKMVKQRRLLKKKLTGIQKLEDKMRRGFVLTEEEKLKVESKQDTERELGELLEKMNLSD